VVCGNKNPKFRNLRNEELKIGPLEIADSVDLMRAEVTSAALRLVLAQKVEQSAKIGDSILIAGNSEGEGVVREVTGKVTGVGPQRVEVDANFVPGYSGSPILLEGNGQVIGVAS